MMGEMREKVNVKQESQKGEQKDKIKIIIKIKENFAEERHKFAK